jgi:hypothetical protein
MPTTPATNRRKPATLQTELLPRDEPFPLSQWLKTRGHSRSQGYRWMQRGWLETEVLCGRRYVTRAAVERLYARMREQHAEAAA